MTDTSPPPAAEPGPAGHLEQPGPRPTRHDVLDLGRLRRSSDDRHIAGVAAGLARHLDIDPVIVRVTLVVLVFFGGAGLLLYGAAWILVPEEGSPARPLGLDDRNRSIALMGTGILAALAAVGDFAGAFWFPWPLVIIGLLVVWFLNRRDRDPQPWGQPVAAYQQDQLDPQHERYQGQPPTYARPRSPRRRGPVLFWATLALIAIGIGTLGVIDASGTAVPDAGYAATAMGITGTMLVLGAFWGRAGGLILVGVLAAAATLVGTASDNWDGTRATIVLTDPGQVRDRYDLGTGEMTLDLSGISDVDGLDGHRLDVNGGVGELEIIVPEGIDVTVDATTGVGGVDVFGQESGGFDAQQNGFVDGGDDAPAMTIEVDLGMGQVTVREQ